MIPGVVDLNLGELSDEELSEVVEAARRELAERQTGAAIVRDVTEAVDPIIRENRGLLGDGWQSGRLSWDGHCMRVEDPGDDPEPLAVAAVEPVAVEPVPEPVAYVVGENYPAGTVVEWDDRLLTVTKGHQATDAWNPDTKPDWFEEV